MAHGGNRDYIYSTIVDGNVRFVYSTDWVGSGPTSSTTFLTSSGTNYADGNWHHVAFVRDNRRT
jgi:hypothetical protein